MSNKVPIAIFTGTISALAFLSVLSGSILALPIFYVASVPIYFAGLSIGAKGVIYAGVSGILVSFILGQGLAIIPFMAASLIPALVICTYFLGHKSKSKGEVEWRPLGTVLAYLIGLGAVLLCCIGFWAEQHSSFEALVVSNLGQALNSLAPGLPDQIYNATLNSISPLFPGMAISSWIIMNIVNAILAQWCLVRANSNLRPTPKYSDIKVPEWSSIAFVVMCALTLIASSNWGYTFTNVALILAIPFFLLGLAVAHKFLERARFSGFLTAAFYMSLMISGWTSLIITFIGAIEQWFGLRILITTQQNEE